ncbi:MAG: RNA-binding protein [Proteobacteria bacterium]|nr:RNA-binding protein [Pseudomonadota bacterium]
MQEGDAETDDRKAVTRLCVATRAVRPVAELIRFVAGPDGVLVPDIRNRLPGRGVWVTNSAPVLRQAIARKALSRALKEQIVVSPELEAVTADLLRRDALQMLSLVNKAGAVTSGFSKIEGGRGAILALVQASDGSSAEIARLQGLCRERGRGRHAPLVIRAFTASEIGLSIGREHVIHAALAVHDAASVFVDRARRYSEFITGGPAKSETISASGPSDVSGSASDQGT